MWAVIRTLSPCCPCIPPDHPSFCDTYPLFQTSITTNRRISWFYSSASRHGPPRSAPALETVFGLLLRDLRFDYLLVLVLRPSTPSILSQAHMGWSHKRQHRRTPWRGRRETLNTWFLVGYNLLFSLSFIFTLPSALNPPPPGPSLPPPQPRTNPASLQILHRQQQHRAHPCVPPAPAPRVQ